MLRLTQKAASPLEMAKAAGLTRATTTSPLAFTTSADADSGGASNKGKLILGGVIAALAVGAIALAATRKSAVPNCGYSRNRKYKTSKAKRAYMKGYRAGKKVCG